MGIFLNYNFLLSCVLHLRTLLPLKGCSQIVHRREAIVAFVMADVMLFYTLKRSKCCQEYEKFRRERASLLRHRTNQLLVQAD